MEKERLDLLLVKKGMIESRARAQAYIRERRVRLKGKIIDKPGTLVKTDSEIEIEKPFPYVSRGALKIKKALENFKINVKNKIAADIGSSTGGFSEVLLKKGAKIVYAVDVNTKQLHYKLQNNEKIVKIEKNARYLLPEDFKFGKPQLFTMDVSFISILKIFPALLKINSDAIFISLIKPQFEGKREFLRKGIVKDKKLLFEIIFAVYKKLFELGLFLKDVEISPIKGQKGNTEFLFLLNTKSESFNKNIEKKIEEVVFGI